MKLLNKKNILKNIILEKRYVESALMLNLIDTDVLNSLIDKIDENNNKSYEQFLILLEEFINYTKSQFYFINNISFNYIIELMLESKYSKILLSNYQWSSSTLIDKYTSDFNKIIIDGFISNVKSFKKVFNFIFKSKKIKLNKLDFNNDKHINEVLNLLKELCFTSANDLSIYRLFDSKYIDSKTIYEITFSKIISNYHKNKFIIN